MPAMRQELQEFVSSCERLIVAHARAGLSEDERSVVKYYLEELPTRLNMLKRSS